MPLLVPNIPDNAPFDPDQRAWLNGFFAGWRTRAGGEATVAPTPSSFGLDHVAVGGDGQALPEPVVANPAGPTYHRKNPFPARMLANRPLNNDGSAKDVRHIEIDVSGSGFTYEAGDALAVIPRNCEAYVAELVAALGWSGDEVVTVDGEDLPLHEALHTRLAVTLPPKSLLDAYAERSGDGLRDMLGDRQALDDFLWGRDVLDLARMYPFIRFEPQAFVDVLRPLQHRLYSISSSPKEHAGEVHLTVGTVRYEAYGRVRKGVCSTFVADRCSAKMPLPVFVQTNKNFRLPADESTSVIMVGPGTGIAPFRAFLEERRGAGAAGRNWLFFGDQHAATDFLYRDELESFLEDGTLDRLDLAWSRDNAVKVYVQHRMLEQAETLFNWIEDGASFYVCGDAGRMAKDVDAALHEVIRTAGGLSEDAAAVYVRRLKSQKRYLRDVY